MWPVRILAGAFGEGVPARDVRLSPDHGVHCDGVLIPARLLVSGATVVREKVDRIVYWHVELDRHDLVLAENLPAESFLDTGNRAAFANGGAATPLHPDFAARTWEGAGCAPLVLTGPKLREARERLDARVAALDAAASSASPRRETA